MVCEHLCTVCGRLRTVCGRLCTVCERLCTVCGHLCTVCEHLCTVCEHLCTVCGRLGTVCGHLCTVCGHLRTVCERLGTVCEHLRTVCERLGTVCGRLGTVCGSLGAASAPKGDQQLDNAPNRFLYDGGEARFSPRMNFSVLLDGAVLLAYFAAIVGVGLAQRSKSGSVEGFALGDRQIAWWAVLASILAAEISAATFLGAPGEGYAKRNWTYAQLAIGTILARIFVSFVFIPIYYKLGVISIYEFLETRFGRLTRKIASGTFLVTRVLAMGTRLYVSAIILVLAWELSFGMPADPQAQGIVKFWLFAGAVVLVTLLTAVYTTVGGIRAVIWTDFIQVGVLVASIGFTIPFLLSKIDGGWATVSAHIQAPVFFDFLPAKEGEGTMAWLARMFSEEYTVYAAFLGSTFVTMATHGIDQDTVQRMLTAKNRRQSAFATIVSGLVDLPVASAFILIGVLLSVYYGAHPTPNLPTEDREVFPFFILQQMPAGLRGLVTAGILATAMGSLSTALNALGTSFARDFAFPRMERDGILVDEWQRVRVLRQSTVFFAFLIVIVGVATAWVMARNPTLRIIPLVLGILGFTFGSLLGVFLVGLLTRRRGNDFGNTIAMLAGLLSVLWASGIPHKFFPGCPQFLPGFELAFPWRITLGSIVTFVVAACFATPEARVGATEKASNSEA